MTTNPIAPVRRTRAIPAARALRGTGHMAITRRIAEWLC
jgi:hypothetical protein